MTDALLPSSSREQPADPDPGPATPLRAGDLCPSCREGHLDYNGLLLLECTRCGRLATTPTVCSC